LTPEEYASAKRTTFNAFSTSPAVIEAIHRAIHRLGVPADAQILEPGCGTGNFLSYGTKQTRFIGVELDLISGRIARALHPDQDIRIENFRDTRLPDSRLDAVIGNVPFADLKLDYQGRKLPLHDYFFAKSVDALMPGGILALVTSHFTLDKQNAALRERLAGKADFVGAIRLPSDAFQREGTAVVTDIVFLRKRAAGEPPRHADPDWLGVAPLTIEGVEVPINRYFLNHPEMVLGAWSRKDTLYGGEGSFLIGDDRTIRQVVDGEAAPVVYGGRTLGANGTMTGKRLAALVGLRDRARRVLQSQNENWPELQREQARREFNRAYDAFAYAYGPVNTTTFGETGEGTVIRRMGQPFVHDDYRSQLAALRDQLKAGLSGKTPEPGGATGPSVSQLAERIKALRAAHTIDAAPERAPHKQATAAEPVTTRIRRNTAANAVGGTTDEAERTVDGPRNGEPVCEEAAPPSAHHVHRRACRERATHVPAAAR
jgi:SAM-dependent methyltransferase